MEEEGASSETSPKCFPPLVPPPAPSFEIGGGGTLQKCGSVCCQQLEFSGTFFGETGRGQRGRKGGTPFFSLTPPFISSLKFGVLLLNPLFFPACNQQESG